MTSIYTSEVIVASGLIGVSAIVIVTSLLVSLPRRKDRPGIDVEAAVRNAPYYRLTEIGINVSPYQQHEAKNFRVSPCGTT